MSRTHGTARHPNFNIPPPPTYSYEKTGGGMAVESNIPYAYHYPTSSSAHGHSFNGSGELYQDEGNNETYLRPSSPDGSTSNVSERSDARTSTPIATVESHFPLPPRSHMYSTHGSLSVADVTSAISTNTPHLPHRRLSMQSPRSRSRTQSACSSSIPQPVPVIRPPTGKHCSLPMPNIPGSPMPPSPASASVCETTIGMQSQLKHGGSVPAISSTAASASEPSPSVFQRPSIAQDETTTMAPLFKAKTSYSVDGRSLNAVNYASLYRRGFTPRRRFFSSTPRSSPAIKGVFTINPFLHIPPELLPPVPPPVLVPAGGSEGNTGSDPAVHRKNLRLEMENGGLDVDIYLLADAPMSSLSDVTLPSHDGHTPIDNDRNRSGVKTLLHLEMSGNERVKSCSLNARIYTPALNYGTERRIQYTPTSYSGSGSTRPPFYLTAINKSSNKSSSTSISLPRSFHGMLTITVHAGDPNNRIVLSKSLSERAVILSESTKARWYFIGEMGNWDRETDKVEVWVVCGKVNLMWEGERDKDSESKKGKWW